MRYTITDDRLRSIVTAMVAEIMGYVGTAHKPVRVDVVCDAGNNPPSIIEQGRVQIAVHMTYGCGADHFYSREVQEPMALGADAESLEAVLSEIQAKAQSFALIATIPEMGLERMVDRNRADVGVFRIKPEGEVPSSKPFSGPRTTHLDDLIYTHLEALNRFEQRARIVSSVMSQLESGRQGALVSVHPKARPNDAEDRMQIILALSQRGFDCSLNAEIESWDEDQHGTMFAARINLYLSVVKAERAPLIEPYSVNFKKLYPDPKLPYPQLEVALNEAMDELDRFVGKPIVGPGRGGAMRNLSNT